MLNRRGLLILGSAAASLTLIGNKQVLALVPETDRYHKVASGAQQAIDSLPIEYHAHRALDKSAPVDSYDRLMHFQTVEATRIRHEWSAWQRRSPGHRAWMRAANDFIGEMLTNFPEMPDVKMVRQVMDTPSDINIFDDADLRGLVPGIVPIAVLRAMVVGYRVPFHMKEMPIFAEFGDRYHRYMVAV